MYDPIYFEKSPKKKESYPPSIKQSSRIKLNQIVPYRIHIRILKYIHYDIDTHPEHADKLKNEKGEPYAYRGRGLLEANMGHCLHDP